MKLFDRKLGEEFLNSVPRTPGIYRVFDQDSHLIYVGKAKNLRRRLGQYRNAKRRKRHLKMRQIIQDASRIEIETCDSDLDATLKETLCIQENRPKWNVAGAFYFLYPMIGIRHSEGVTSFCYTTEPEFFQGFEMHGAFRSRQRTRDAYFALLNLLPYLCHRIDRSHAVRGPKFSYSRSFRRFPEEWQCHWRRFWRGESKEALEHLVLALIENAGARKRTKEVQENLNYLSRFWRHEAVPLARARIFNQYTQYPVPQKDRDLIFLKFRAVHSK